jgi:hypothetical protein
MRERTSEQTSGPGRRELMQTGVAGSLLGVKAAAGGEPASAQAGTPTAAGGAKHQARIDPAAVQVLFVDLQASLVAQSKTTLPGTIETASGVLAKVAHILKLPNLFSVVLEGGKPPKLIASLLPYSKPANTILRKPAGALMDPATVQAVARSGRRTLVIAGYAAEVAVLHAALDAIAAGYTVYYVVDCIGSASPRTEAAAFRELELAGAIPTSVLSLTTRLAPDFTSPPGSETFAALDPIVKQ